MPPKSEPADSGRSYRCRQRSLERTVAVKVLATDLDPDNLERFLREQRAMGKLSGHPNIVTVFEVGATAVGSALHRVAVSAQRNPLDARIRSVPAHSAGRRRCTSA